MNCKNTCKYLKSQGQLSIFAALVFQTLFVLFAMSLNVALVVHDKINLQNSVDLAAYYGAMKQAELLNTVAHINYQIRQSWKLLVWRNIILGSLQKDLGTPLSSTHDGRFVPYTYRGNPLYVTCMSHQQWGQLLGEHISNPDRDAVCNRAGFPLPFHRVPSSGGGGSWSGLGAFIAGVQTANDNLEKTCNRYGFNSWFFAFQSLMLFQRDQSKRKKLIYKIVNLLMDKDLDLDGELIEKGARKTLYHNLTYINQKSISDENDPAFEFHNSLKDLRTDWLKDPWFKPYLYYLHSKGDLDSRNNNCPYHPANVLTKPHELICPGGVCPHFINEAMNNFRLQGDGTFKDSNIYPMSAGLYKDQTKIIFYAVKATLPYKGQIFLPANLKLQAYAVAKPFGGRIGPPLNVDKLLPKHGRSPSSLTDAYTHYGLNYSRYPNDQFGLKSQISHFVWKTHLWKVHLNHQKNMHYYYRGATTDDILVRKSIGSNQLDTEARKWEILAIAPDLFDVTYFSIMPEFMSTYYKRLEKTSIKNFVVADLGWEGNHRDYKNIFHYQIEKVKGDLRGMAPLFYKITKMTQLLTGWNPPREKYKDTDVYTPNDYSDFTFSECDNAAVTWKPSFPVDRKVATGCKSGSKQNGRFLSGRSGYSVKLISPCLVKTEDTGDLLAGIDCQPVGP